jgi:hypothetical protein
MQTGMTRTRGPRPYYSDSNMKHSPWDIQEIIHIAYTNDQDKKFQISLFWYQYAALPRIVT